MAYIQTVHGPIAPDELGPTLIHEHVMVDFAGAEVTGPHRWDRDEVVQVMRPFLEEIVTQGITGLGECTPNYLGRDPALLLELSTLTGLHIVTNTGLYKEPYLPAWAFELEPEDVAARWIAEWEQGIDDTGIKPGFIKIAVNPGRLVPIQQKIVRAAAITHRETGLSVVCHTAHGRAAHESLDIVEDEGMDPQHYVIVHADQIGFTDMDAFAVGELQMPLEDVYQAHEALFRRGAWLEYDSIGADSLDRHTALVATMVERGYEDQILLSQDAGWYNVGEPGGGTVRPLTDLMGRFLPRLRAADVGTVVIKKLIVSNPRRLLSIG